MESWLIPMIVGAIATFVAFAALQFTGTNPSRLFDARATLRVILTKTGVAVSLVLFLLFWIAWPYQAAYNLAIAIKDGNADAIESGVDWEHLRQALRGDLNATLLQNLSRAGSSPASGLAAALAPVVVNQIVDGYVTPQGIASLVGQRIRGAGGGEHPGGTSSGDRRLDFSRIQYAFFDGGPFSFKVELRNESPNQEPFVFLFGWGGRWRLNRLVLPKSVFANAIEKKPAPLSSPASGLSKKAGGTALADSSGGSASAPSQSPFKVSLMSKGYKNSDPGNGDFEDDITFSLAIENISAKDIRAFDGTLTFTDLLDNEIHSSLLAINERVNAGATLVWNGKLKYNQFIDSHQRLRNASFNNLKIKFAPRKVLLLDGRLEQLNR